MQEVQAMCSRAIIISSGRVVADDSIDKLKKVNAQGALTVVFESDVNEGLIKGLKNLVRYDNMGNMRWKLHTEKPDELRKEVMQMALNNNLNISSLQADSQSLEDVFRVLTK
jgi:ABC-2 type transport system ATP-binding protein